MTTLTIVALPTGEPHAAAAPTRHVVADEPSSFPCRRCLRDAQPGDTLLLTPYDPFPVASPYAGDGPIYVHADGCPAHADDGAIPAFMAHRDALSVRGYDADGMLSHCEVCTGAEIEERAGAMLADGAEFVHVHNARPGCFMFTIRGSAPA
jgi:hypothetical protein